MEKSDAFGGCRVLALESRRGDDMRRMIAAQGGVPLVVQSLEERACGLSTGLLAFADRLRRGDIAMVIFLTGTGARMLARALDGTLPLPAFAGALNETIVIARGPKPMAALRQLGVTAPRPVAPPHTWREILRRIDDDAVPVRGRRVAIQEYGAPPDGLLEGLRERGAVVLRLLVYEWALPSDTQPLRDAVAAAAAGRIDVLLVTSAVQVKHLFEIAAALGLVDALKRARKRMRIASIGPTTTQALGEHGIVPDLEASKPNMGVLVAEAAGGPGHRMTTRISGDAAPASRQSSPRRPRAS